MARWLPATAALSAGMSIAVGAAAAHAVHDPVARGWLQTGAQFQLPHAVAVFALLGWRDSARVRGAAWALLTGSLVFSGSLDLMALGSPRWFGAITPIGGLAMIVGWLWLAIVALMPERPRQSLEPSDKPVSL